MGGARIGLFGGTFDPPHLGHLAAAHSVREELGLDEVWLVVANDPWQKQGTRSVTPAATRLEWVTQAVAGIDGLQVCDVEMERGGPSYTIDTLEELSDKYPGNAWLVVVGADAAAGLDSWHRAEDLRARAEIVVVTRPGEFAEPSSGWKTILVETPALDVSSSQLRSMVAQGKSIRFLVPDGVVELVTSSGAYRQVS